MTRLIDPNTFVPIPGYEGVYAINQLGQIRRDRAVKGARVGHIRKTAIHKTRHYEIVRLYRECKGKNHDVHALVASTFLGPRPEGMEVCHDDGVHTNNHLSNLRYDTPKANQADKIRHGTTNRGERNGHAKYDRAKIQEIRAAVHAGERVPSIASRLGMPQTTIRNIKNGYRWAWLQD